MNGLFGFTVVRGLDGQAVKTGLVRAKQLAELLGIHRNTIYSLVRSGVLPEPVRLAPRIVGWRIEDVERVIAERQGLARLDR